MLKRLSIIVVSVFCLLVFHSPAAADSLSEVFTRVNPTVVVIHTLERGYTDQAPGAQVTGKGLGSGVVVTDDGLIMTAAHVVQVADAVTVNFHDGRKIAARVIASAVSADVALLELETVPEDLAAAPLGNSDQVRIGDRVMVVGAPLGIEHTLTVGHISGRRKVPTPFQQPVPVEFLQTDAAINRGNSGGPVFDMQGRVVGIVSFIMTQSGGSDGIGFAAAINTANQLLLTQRSFWTGLELQFLAGDLAKALNLPQEAGLLVQRVADNSPGSEWGLKAGHIPIMIGPERLILGGDVILSIQGMDVTTDLEQLQKVRETIWSLTAMSQVEIKVLRAGKVMSLSSNPQTTAN